MAITRAQQVRQMLEDGGMLVQPSITGKRPGYRGDAAAKAAEKREAETGQKSSRAATTSRSDPGESDTPGFNPDTGRFERPDPSGPPGTMIPEKARTVKEVKQDLRRAVNQGAFRKKGFFDTVFPVATNLIDSLGRTKIARINNALQRQNYIDSLDLNDPKEKAEYDRIMNELGGLGIDIIAGPETLTDTSLKQPMSLGAPKTKFKPSMSFDDGVSSLGDPDVKDILGEGFQEYLNRFDSPDRDDRGPSDPCLGPNPPAYCFIGQRAETPPEAPVFTPAFRFMNRGGMVEDAPMGGIMDLETTRQMLFIGGIAKGISKGLKSVTRGLKKVAKSPLGKAALLGAVGFGIPGTSFGGLFGRAKFGKPALGAFGKFGIGPTLFANPTITQMKLQGLEKGFFPKLFGNMSGLKVAALSGLGGALLSNVGKDDDDGFDIEEYYKMAGIDIPENQYRFLSDGGSEDLSKDPNYKGWVKLYEKNPDIAAMNDKHKEYLTFYQREQNKQAEGSREPVAKKTMPLLDLEGQEMDFRQDGGFVPIGRMEKADDVPARLSKNEFVFTAEAVRNAGGGDVDKGAEVMYNTMKNLEAGGEVSEETQGLEGARKMFQTSQRLGEVV